MKGKLKSVSWRGFSFYADDRNRTKDSICFCLKFSLLNKENIKKVINVKHLSIVLFLLIINIFPVYGKKSTESVKSLNEKIKLYEKQIKEISEKYKKILNEYLKENQKIILLTQENERLKLENLRLALEIEDLKFGEEKLLNDINFLFKEGKYYQTKEKIDVFISKYKYSKYLDELKIIYTKSEEIIAKLEEEKKERMKQALLNMEEDYDEFKKISFYFHKERTQVDNGMYLYFGLEKDSNPFLRMVMIVRADYLYAKSILVKINEDVIECPVSYNSISHGDFESLDVMIEQKSIYFDILKNIITANNVIKIRFSGDYYKDIEVSEEDITKMKEVYEAYLALGGNLKFENE